MDTLHPWQSREPFDGAHAWTAIQPGKSRASFKEPDHTTTAEQDCERYCKAIDNYLETLR